MSEATEEVKIKTYGTRSEVFDGIAKKTKGNLTKDDIIFESGKYKSKKAIAKGKALVNQLRGIKEDKLQEPEPEEAKAKDLTDKKVIKRTQRVPKTITPLEPTPLESISEESDQEETD